MCRTLADGGRRCDSTKAGRRHAQTLQRHARARKRHQDAQQAVTAFIGATPFRPESEALLAMSSRPSYYDSDEWQEWSDRIETAAERNNVTLVRGTPQQEHADGLWEGETEPSGAYTATGSREDIENWAAQIAGHYNQDAVMVMYADPNGKDHLHTFTADDPVRTQQALDAMKGAGIPGGRVVDGRLEIVSIHGDDAISPAALDLLHKRLGGDVSTTPITAKFVEKNEDYLAHTPIKEIQGIRQRHAEKHDLPVRGRCPHLTDQDNIAAAMVYDAGEHTPDDPRIKRSYRTFRRHLVEQHDALTAAGYTFIPWEGEDQPYANSAEMMKDLRDNKRLYFYRTEVSQDTEGALPDDHPMARMVTVRDKDGKAHRMVANDCFRAVHDAIARSEGHSFGPEGEKMAWFTHRSSLPREAHLALWNETRAQNVWTNNGPHMQTPDGLGGVRTLRKGEEGWMPLPDRPYANQKCVLVDPSFT